MEIVRLSTGHVCCLLSHWTMQSAQNACSHLNKTDLIHLTQIFSVDSNIFSN